MRRLTVPDPSSLAPFSAARYIREIGRGAKGARSLSREDTHALFSAMLDGQLSDLELGAVLLAYRIKGESPIELAAMLEATHRRCEPLIPPTAGVPVVIPSYNGARRRPNLVPLLALLLARAGVPVLVHGIAAFPGRVTTATLFESLAIPACTSVAQMTAQLQEKRIAFVPITLISPTLAALLGKRELIGLRNSAHTICKLIQPFGTHGPAEALRLVSYTHPLYRQALTELFLQEPSNVLLTRGTEGEVVADTRRVTQTDWLHGGTMSTVQESNDSSGPPVDSLPADNDAQATVRWIRAVLDGTFAVPDQIARQVEIILGIVQAQSHAPATSATAA